MIVESLFVEQQLNSEQKNNGVISKKQLPSWREMNLDTTPEADLVLFKLWRETPAWRKLQIMEGLNRTARQMALMGLKKRFPNASPEELKRHLAAIAIGEELANTVYGPLPRK